MSKPIRPSTKIIRVRSALRGVATDGKPEIIDDAGIAIREGRIVSIGPAAEIMSAHPEATVDVQADRVAIPGLVNAHHHSGLTPIQLGVPFAPLELWLPRFMGMRYVDPRLDTLYSAIEMLESGTTTVHHIQGGVYGAPETWQGPADAIIGAYREIGMRVSYSFMIRDQNQVLFDDDDTFLAMLPSPMADHFRPRLKVGRAPVAEMLDFFSASKKRWAELDPDHVRWQLAPANLHWCSDTALTAIFDRARQEGVKVHMHLDETSLQADYARQRTGKSATRHLHDLGCLGPNLTIGHGIWADRADLNLLAHHGCCLCHNPSSGLRLASGIAPVNVAREIGLKVALGIDQCGVNDDRDMLQEMRVAWMIHREPGLFQDRPSAASIYKMATEHGAATTGFAGKIGRLDPDRNADIVLIDWNSIARPYLDARTPMLDALLHRGKVVDRVYLGGEIVVDQGKACMIDRAALIEEITSALSAPLSPTETEASLMAEAAIPHIERYYAMRGVQRHTTRYIFNQNNF